MNASRPSVAAHPVPNMTPQRPDRWLDFLRRVPGGALSASRDALLRFRSRCGRVAALARNRRRTFLHELAVCAIFRDEAVYLDEWLAVHHALGAGHFYLYNNRSADNFREVLEPWIKRGLVTLSDWTGNQFEAYDDCLKCHRKHARWIAFIDLDEFLFSPAGRDLRTVLRDYEGAAGVFVYWCLFGSNGHSERPAGPVIENYTKCLGLEAMRSDLRPLGRSTGNGFLHITSRSGNGKSIVNPRLVARSGIHRPKELWSGRMIDERGRDLAADHTNVPDFSFDILRINHYWSKSRADLMKKIESKRKWVSANNLKVRYDPSPEQWIEREHQLNSSTDTTLRDIWRGIHRQP